MRILIKIIVLVLLFVIVVSLYFNYNHKEYKFNGIEVISDTVYVEFDGDLPTISDLEKSKVLFKQILITTHPNLSFFNKIPKKNWGYNFLKKYIYIDQTHIVANEQYGGVILYDYNVPQANQYGGLKYFSFFLRKLNTQNILLYDTLRKKKFLASIFPLITTDADIPITTKRVSEYYRFKDFFKVENFIDSGLIGHYSSVGINSCLCPQVDWIDIDKSFEKKIDTLIELFYSHKMVPCLKHFCYDRTQGNTHYEPSKNKKSIELLLSEDLKPYKYFSDKFPAPFLIMVGHHKIMGLDSVNIASQSRKVEDYIKYNYKNAITVSDEITMKASKKNGNFEFIKKVSTDFILAHGGNLSNYRPELLKEISKLDSSSLNTKIKNILRLKDYYGLIKFKKIN